MTCELEGKSYDWRLLPKEMIKVSKKAFNQHQTLATIHMWTEATRHPPTPSHITPPPAPSPTKHTHKQNTH